MGPVIGGMHGLKLGYAAVWVCDPFYATSRAHVSIGANLFDRSKAHIPTFFTVELKFFSPGSGEAMHYKVREGICSNSRAPTVR